MLHELQEQQKPWVKHNFGDRPSWQPLLGVVEEVGELSHAYLKRAQKIRTNKDHDAAIKDAVADIVVFLCDFCSAEDIDLQTEVARVWNEIEKRDWKKNSKTGV